MHDNLFDLDECSIGKIIHISFSAMIFSQLENSDIDTWPQANQVCLCPLQKQESQCAK